MDEGSRQDNVKNETQDAAVFSAAVVISPSSATSPSAFSHCASHGCCCPYIALAGAPDLHTLLFSIRLLDFAPREASRGFTETSVTALLLLTDTKL
jgi:hypothetical protein